MRTQICNDLLDLNCRDVQEFSLTVSLTADRAKNPGVGSLWNLMDFLRISSNICEGRKALKRKFCFIPRVVSNKCLFYAFISDQVEWLAQNCSISFHDILDTGGHASPAVSLHTCGLCSCVQLLGKEVVFSGGVDSDLDSVVGCTASEEPVNLSVP